MALYKIYGKEFYAELNGWFSGVVVDRRQNSVTLFNDRYSVGRVYYHETDEEFVFSSEAKSLLRIRPGLRKLSQAALAEQLGYNCVIGNRSLFQGIQLLPHAAAWSFRDGAALERRPYSTSESGRRNRN